MGKLAWTFALLLTLRCAYAGDYFPMQVGNEWNYVRIDSTGQRAGVDTLMLIQRTIEGAPEVEYYHTMRREFGGFSHQSWFTTLVRDSGNVVYASLLSGTWYHPDVMAFHSYQGITRFKGRTGYWTVKYEGRVTVPVGTFDSCYSISEDTPDKPLTHVYAPGVGRIKVIDRSEKTTSLLVRYKVDGIAGIRDVSARRTGPGFRRPDRFGLPGGPEAFRADGRMVRAAGAPRL